MVISHLDERATARRRVSCTSCSVRCTSSASSAAPHARTDEGGTNDGGSEGCRFARRLPGPSARAFLWRRLVRSRSGCACRVRHGVGKVHTVADDLSMLSLGVTLTTLQS